MTALQLIKEIPLPTKIAVAVLVAVFYVTLLASIQVILTNERVKYTTAAIYLIFFHPLAKIPGPLLSKISVWPSFYHTIRGNRHVWLWQLHEIYGKINACLR